MTDVIDPVAPDALEDPYPLYDLLQREQPVTQLPGTDIWLVSRHADVVEAASKPGVFSSNISAVVYRGEGPNPVVLQADPDAIGAVDVWATADPPAHSVQRKLMNRVFAPARISALQPLIEEIVASTLDAAVARGEMEWVDDLPNPLAVQVISQVLGLPSSDGDRLKQWADAGVDLLSGVASPERLDECGQLIVGFLNYLRETLAAPTVGSVTAESAEGVARGDLSEREGVSLMLQ